MPRFAELNRYPARNFPYQSTVAAVRKKNAAYLNPIS
jgi:hypothetical protein